MVGDGDAGNRKFRGQIYQSIGLQRAVRFFSVAMQITVQAITSDKNAVSCAPDNTYLQLFLKKLQQALIELV
jgi:hypothetical protein